MAEHTLPAGWTGAQLDGALERVRSTGIVYISGDATTDGSTRINGNGGQLLAQRRVLGSWVTQDDLEVDLSGSGGVTASDLAAAVGLLNTADAGLDTRVSTLEAADPAQVATDLAAETTARTSADSGLDGRISALEGTAAHHTHANQAVLDAVTDAGSGAVITAVERAALAAATLAGHTHGNQATLDAITDAGSGSVITAAERTALAAAAAATDLAAETAARTSGDGALDTRVTALEAIPPAAVVVNDRTTGGATSVLSAEQGKLTKVELDAHAADAAQHLPAGGTALQYLRKNAGNTGYEYADVSVSSANVVDGFGAPPDTLGRDGDLYHQRDAADPDLDGWVKSAGTWGGAPTFAFEQNVAKSTTVAPAADDATGVAGGSDQYAPGDHKHPAQGISADAGNALGLGADGLHALPTFAVTVVPTGGAAVAYPTNPKLNDACVIAAAAGFEITGTDVGVLTDSGIVVIPNVTADVTVNVTVAAVVSLNADDINPRFYGEAVDSGSATAADLTWHDTSGGASPAANRNDVLHLAEDTTLDGTPWTAGTKLRAVRNTTGGVVADWEEWVSPTGVIDDNTMAAKSTTQPPSQNSVRQWVAGVRLTAEPLDFDAVTNAAISYRFNGNTSTLTNRPTGVPATIQGWTGYYGHGNSNGTQLLRTSAHGSWERKRVLGVWGAWIQTAQAPVATKAGGAVPEVGRLNLYPVGEDLTALAQPTVHAGQEYAVAALTATGYDKSAMRHYAESGGAWVLAEGANSTTETYTGLQLVADVTAGMPLELTGPFQDIATGVDLNTVDLIEFDITDNSDGFVGTSSINPKHVVLGQDNGGIAHWAGTSYVRVRIDDAAAFAAGTIRVGEVNSNMRVHGVRLLAYAANAYVIPTGTTVAVERTLTAAGGTNTINGAATATFFEGYVQEAVLGMPVGHQLAFGVTLSSGDPVEIVNAAEGRVSFAVTADATLTYTTEPVAPGVWVDVLAGVIVQGGGAFAMPTGGVEAARYMIDGKLLHLQISIDWRASTGGDNGTGTYWIDIAQFGGATLLDTAFDALHDPTSQYSCVHYPGVGVYHDPGSTARRGNASKAVPANSIKFTFESAAAIGSTNDWGAAFGNVGARAHYLLSCVLPIV